MPYHLIYDSNVALNNLNDFIRYIISVIRYWDSMIAISSHLNSKIYRLQKTYGVNTTQNKASLIKSFRTLG